MPGSSITASMNVVWQQVGPKLAATEPEHGEAARAELQRLVGEAIAPRSELLGLNTTTELRLLHGTRTHMYYEGQEGLRHAAGGSHRAAAHGQ